jgi:hypothetical protein
MTFTEALAALVGHPHLRRYRELCDSEDAETREGYRSFVVALAAGDRPSGVISRASLAPEKRLELAESLALTRSMRSCPFRSTRGCGCGGAACALRGSAGVNHVDCFACIRSYG